MEINEQTLQYLASYISQTLSPLPDVRKPAEKYLESVEGTANYPLLLLHLINSPSLDPSIRVAGAIAFKNFIKRNWEIQEDVPSKIQEQDRQAIKREIVDLMLKSPENIQRQLSDAISVIGRHDFPANWPTLMQDLVQKLQTEDFHVINGVLRTAHSLFKRYRFEFKSDKLWLEIKLVLEQFAGPLTQLFLTLMGMAKQHESNKEAITVIYSSLLLVSKIFYSLNSQEIPEFFEDNIKTWMPNFHALLVTDIPLLKTGDEEPGILEQIRSQICDNVGMYARKYDEEFEEFLPLFVTAVWTLLVSTGNQMKFDMLVSNSIQFLALVAEKDRNKHLFENEETMSSICQKVIIPNMEFREADEELFEDNAEEYIRRDIEGSDVDTRRRAACDFVRALSRHFETKMTEIFGMYVQEMLIKYQQNPQAAWKSKDAAIYLVTSLVAKGQTQKEGVTKTNALVSVPDFYGAHILAELANPNVNELPVLKADAIKYLMIFRNQLPPQTIKESIQHLVKFLGAESAVINSYAASCLEKILLLKQTDNTPLIKAQDLAPVGGNLIGGLFGVLSKQTSKENEYVMKAIMRSTSALQEAVIPFMKDMLPKLMDILIIAARNPSKPHFNHYMFETLCLCIRIICKQNPAAVEQFEAGLFPVFQGILQQDVSEFIPYLFQVLSLMLDFHTTGISDPYMMLFPLLMQPTLWEKNANIPPLVRLLQVYVKKGPAQVVGTDKLNAILGIFQKLLASKTNDHEGFNLVTSLVNHLPTEAMAQYLKPLFCLLFQRLTSSKTVKFVKCLIVYFGTYINKYGAQNFVEMLDSVEPNLMAKVLDRLFISEMQKISGPLEKKVVAVGVTRLLCECPQSMLTGQYSMYWPPLLNALIQMFECAEDQSVNEDEHFAEIEEISSYQASYAKLNFGGISVDDPFNGTIPDAKIFLAQSLKGSAAESGLAALTSSINPDAQTFLARYFAAANIAI